MGCFLACFGFKKKKKRSSKNPSGEQNHGSYIPLDSLVSINLNTAEQHRILSDSEIKEKPKDQTRLKIKKKVSFNLNVKAYEPIRNEEDIGIYLSEGEEETKWEFNTDSGRLINLHYEEDSTASSIRLYPQNYRYQNFRDSYEDEDDELENDSNFDSIADSEEEMKNGYSSGSGDENEMLGQEDFPWKLSLVAKKSENEAIDDPVTGKRNGNLEQLSELRCKEHKGLKSNCHVKHSSPCMFSILNPVENLTQWKAIKAKPATLKCQKENVMLEQHEQNPTNTKANSNSFTLQNTRNSIVLPTPGHSNAVDASLSNWLSSFETQKHMKNSVTSVHASVSHKNKTDMQIS